MRNALVCAALDIGTTHSGYAYSTRNEYEKEPTNIHTNIWKGSSLCSFKAPTAVLLDSGQKLVAFGYEAENMYSELVADEEHEDYYYFRKLMMLPEKVCIISKTNGYIVSILPYTMALKYSC